MIASILPAAIAAVEMREDPADAVLLPAEAAAVERAVDSRRREFTTVRHCARLAMARLGVPPHPLVPGPGRAPAWPADLVGSMTHCTGYRAAAVARAHDCPSVGIDAEPHAPLPEGVDRLVVLPAEREQLRSLAAVCPETHFDRVLFSAKESVYKTWFPLTGRWLGFEDACLTIDPHAGTFTADLLVPGPILGGAAITAFSGRWLVHDGLVLTAVALPPIDAYGR